MNYFSFFFNYISFKIILLYSIFICIFQSKSREETSFRVFSIIFIFKVFFFVNIFRMITYRVFLYKTLQVLNTINDFS